VVTLSGSQGPLRRSCSEGCQHACQKRPGSNLLRLSKNTPGAGHFGVFNGKRWETQIYPILRNVILANER
jgi:poly(3-hydroxybutyrate) depolymerase